MRSWKCGGMRWAHRQRPSHELLSQLSFDQHYKIRSNIELLIQDYASKPIAPLNYEYFLQYRPAADQERGVHADDQDNQPVAFIDV